MTQNICSFTNRHFYKVVLILIGLAVLLLSIQTPPAFAAAPTTDPIIRLQDDMQSPLDAPQVVRQFEETSYYLKDVAFVTADVGWAVGEPHWDQTEKRYKGTIIKTTNAGETWSAQEAGVTEGFRGVCFLDANQGWVVGANGTIRHTSDGGNLWVKQTVATTDDFRGVVFVDNNTGWATCVKPMHYNRKEEADDWQAAIWHTDDGGENWVQQAVPTNTSILHNIDFIDSLSGWAVGTKLVGDDGLHPQHEGAIYHTSDGGLTWSEQYSPGQKITFTTVDFLDATNGWVVGFPTRSSLKGGFVFHTADGGKTWDRQEPGGIFDPLWDVQFVDKNRGYVVGFNYVGAWGPPVWRTLDGGVTWTKIIMEKCESEGLFGVAVVGNQVIAVGDRDFVVKSVRAWDSCEWVSPEPPCNHCGCLFNQSYINTHYRFEDVFFADENHGWAVGRRSYEPQLWGQVIFHTQDGDVNWEIQYEHAPPLDGLFSYHRLNSVYFTDNENGWAVGRSESFWNASVEPSGARERHGAILHTMDGGMNWEEQGSELYEGRNREFLAVQFLDSQNGWALAAKRYPSRNISLAHTTDGGNHWEWVDTGIEGSIGITLKTVQGDVVFTDDQHGWVAGGRGHVIHTEDGGITWVKQELSCGNYITRCSDRCFGIAFVDNQSGWIAGSKLYHTTDGGANWTPQDIEVDGDLQDIQFIDSHIGWLAGEWGVLMYTADGGNEWHHMDSNTFFTLRGLFFVNPQLGWIVGDYGTILRYAAEQLPKGSEQWL
jgi:photosystem II stability/assembly factor-like uncharacterized protein